MYAGKPCRINTYGDSFTQCHQVSDGETWQEYLAAHLGEPIRNFGMGGYGAYQAYRRMAREERTDHGAKYLIFYIWGDDHIRSLLRCRHALIYPRWDHQGGRMFHNNFWPNLEMELDTGRFVEKENLLPTPESLARMCDPEWMVEHLKDDLALQLYAFKLGYIRGLDRPPIDRLAARLAYPLNWGDGASLRAQAGELLDRYSLRATRLVLEKARRFADDHIVVRPPGLVHYGGQVWWLTTSATTIAAMTASTARTANEIFHQLYGLEPMTSPVRPLTSTCQLLPA